MLLVATFPRVACAICFFKNLRDAVLHFILFFFFKPTTINRRILWYSKFRNTFASQVLRTTCLGLFLMLCDKDAMGSWYPERIEMIYRGPGFLGSYDLTPPPTPPPSIWRHMHRETEKERQLDDGRGRSGGMRGAKLYECENVWSSIHHSILSAGTSLKVTGVVARGGGGWGWLADFL